MRTTLSHRLIPLTIALAVALPILPIALWSVADRWRYPNRFPRLWGANGWRDFLATGGLAALGHSLAIGVCVAIIVIPTSFLAARVMVRLGGWQARLLEAVHYLPVFLPPFVLVMGVTTGSVTLQIPSQIAVIATLSVLAFPYAVFTLRSAFVNYESRWEETGTLLGAKGIQLFLRIRIPMLKNALLASGFIAFLIGWSDYIVTLVVGGGQVITLPLLIGSSASRAGNDSTLAALSIVTIAIPMVMGLLIQRMGSRGKRGVAA